MADKQSEHESGEDLTRPPGPTAACAGPAVIEDTPDRVSGAAISDPGARHGSDVPAGCAEFSRSERMLWGNKDFSIARRSDPAQLILAGDIDFPSVPHLIAALLDAADSSGVLHVDLADVYFCDLAALRTIIGLGQHREDQQPRRRARSVVLHNVPAHIERVMRIVGWDTTPGLTIDTGGTSTQQPGDTPPAHVPATARANSPLTLDQHSSPEPP